MTRPYTAVLINWQGHETQVITVSAPYEYPDAAKHVEAAHPGSCLVALIPGDHSGHSRGYPLRYTGERIPEAGRLSAAQQMDLFDIDIDAFED